MSISRLWAHHIKMIEDHGRASSSKSKSLWISIDYLDSIHSLISLFLNNTQRLYFFPLRIHSFSALAFWGDWVALEPGGKGCVLWSQWCSGMDEPYFTWRVSGGRFQDAGKDATSPRRATKRKVLSCFVWTTAGQSWKLMKLPEAEQTPQRNCPGGHSLSYVEQKHCSWSLEE